VHNTRVLRLDGYAKRFGSATALAGASCTVRTGELVGLIGPNGAGKTTMLECAAGIRDSDAGASFVDGAPLAANDVKRNVFYLPDAIRPWPDQRVRWVLHFVSALFGAAPHSVAELSDALALGAVSGQRVRELSKGECKRLLIAIGLLTPAPFLLLDEPFDGLDIRQVRDVAQLLRAHAGRGRGLCLSIHQLTDAARLCDRLVLLAGGRSAAEGTLDALRAQAGLPGTAGIEDVFLAFT
jgi:ABC-type multidrug transport system ATPase subunit